jgi:hypothetical protein
METLLLEFPADWGEGCISSSLQATRIDISTVMTPNFSITGMCRHVILATLFISYYLFSIK